MQKNFMMEGSKSINWMIKVKKQIITVIQIKVIGSKIIGKQDGESVQHF